MIALTAISLPSVLSAQTDFYNTDRGRPVQIEDAYATERHAFELKVAPVRLERQRGGIYNWNLEPEVAYGVLPRTHIELGAPLAYTDVAGPTRRSGLAGLELSVLYNLNTETETFPAFGLRGDVLAPVGSLAPDRAYSTVTGIATRTYGWMRFHLNGQYTFGAAPSAGQTLPQAIEVSRWLAGIALDKTYPLRSLLLTGDFYARKPLDTAQELEYNAGAGLRYQWSPTLAVDVGLGRRINGDNPAWFVTFGSAYAFALASLIPGAGR